MGGGSDTKPLKLYSQIKTIFHLEGNHFIYLHVQLLHKLKLVQPVNNLILVLCSPLKTKQKTQGNQTKFFNFKNLKPICCYLQILGRKIRTSGDLFSERNQSYIRGQFNVFLIYESSIILIWEGGKEGKVIYMFLLFVAPFTKFMEEILTFK